MESIFNFFNQGWVGSLIGIVGVVFGIVGMFSYKFSKSTAKPSFQTSSLSLLGSRDDNLPEDVTVLYKGTKVERLSKSTIVIWNNGTEVLNGEDIVDSDPVRFSFPEGSNILSYNIVKITRDTNKVSLKKEEATENELYIQFSYLDPKDGATIEILHDSEDSHPLVKGTIKGLPKGVENLGRFYRNRPLNTNFPFNLLLSNRKMLLGLFIVAGLCLFILGMLPIGLTNIVLKKKDLDESSFRVALSITGLIYAALPAALLWYRREKYPKKLNISETES
ncbi:hypothetical protein [Vibrio fluvialis]|uniref:hypothetical protein n=1 Tax=Vibrio fluvialis TaxID=676 RepID=UPI00192B3BCB|nr:hypothetical protein [Vibrio fluvialis]MBL4282375.1 hypothetical protein [Vibrio fluvialis]